MITIGSQQFKQFHGGVHFYSNNICNANEFACIPYRHWKKSVMDSRRLTSLVLKKRQNVYRVYFSSLWKKLIWNADKTRCTCSNFHANVGILEVTFMLEYGINKYISIAYEDSLPRVSSSAKLNPWGQKMHLVSIFDIMQDAQPVYQRKTAKSIEFLGCLTFNNVTVWISCV